ncbi:28S ribosomal protein S24, mitochondrial-like [Argiope bruennichi]|uniref:28S ribosomal protein S24 like protein n=1 Tax=Argiope bruennichi TaxID=94029 RepID=A0A8T0EE95_ARGBR|nr:28S ribosomal protein S24, mitochondrial-like [Argiope bruennichi]KAF8771201.1 28S ribosomal protein S24 like protein [Argiope bruennichi]
MAALCKNVFSPINMALATRTISTSAICCKAQAGRHKRTKNQSKPLTYEQFNGPFQIHHRKSWNTWNTTNLLDGDDEIRASQTAVEDFFIRKFMFGTWHKLFVSDVIIKRRHNLIVITGIIVRSLQVRKLYFLIGYTEEMLSYIFKCPVKIELQSTPDRKDVVFKYV